MQINFSKTKSISFNTSNQVDFTPKFTLSGHDIEAVEEMKVLGLIIRSDLKWSSNTDNLIKKAFNELWMPRRLKTLGTRKEELTDIYS